MGVMKTSMKFSLLFEEGIMCWPDEISISSGKRQGEGFFFQELSSAWDTVEEEYAKKGEWQGLITWGIFSGLHKLAKEGYLNNNEKISKLDIDKVYVEAKLSESLFADNGEANLNYSEKMKEQYQNDFSS